MQDPKLKKIGGLFEKYQRTLVAPEGSVKKEVCEVIEDVCGFRVSEEKISYSVSTKVVSLQVQSVLKQEILIRKDELLAHLKGRLGPKSAPTAII